MLFSARLRTVVCFGLLWAAAVVQASNIGHAPQRHARPQIIKVPMQQDIPPGYVVYPIPPFSVVFKTINTLSGDADADAALLQSEMAQPLKKIVGQFIKSSFEDEVAKLAQHNVQAIANGTPELKVPQVILDFVSLDFQVTIQHRFTQDAARSRGRQRQLEDESASSWYLDFYSEFIGVAFFLEPLNQEARDNVPSVEQMHDLMLGWINHNLQDMQDIISGFQTSPVAILNNVQSLQVDTDIAVGDSSPFDGEINGGSDDEESEMVRTKWGNAVFTAIFVLICAGLLVVGAIIIRLVSPMVVPFFQDHSIDPTHRGSGNVGSGGGTGGSSIVGPLSNVFGSKMKGDLERPMSPGGSSGGNGSDHSKNEVLPGRGSENDEELLVQHESDRWLMEHRPDLYAAVKKSSQTASSGPEDFSNDDDDASQRKSLPMQFLLGGMFKSHAGAVGGPPPPPRDDDDNEDSEAPFVDEYSGTGPPSVEGSPNWWNKVLQGLKGKQLACDEDPTQYPFAYQDFPRHDGTPCLIYSEDMMKGTARVVRADGANRPLSPSSPHANALSNDEFKRVLSLNSEDGVVLEEPSHLEEDEDEIVFSSITPPAPPLNSRSPEFTDKLEHLMAMRHRHYERQNLLDKHKKTRESQQQRLQQEEEARQRQLKLRRHEMELDMTEIEGQLRPPAMTRRDRQISDENNSHSTSGSKSPTTAAVLSTTPEEPTGMGIGGMERRKSSTLHRVTASDPDFHVVTAFAHQRGRGSSGSGSIGNFHHQHTHSASSSHNVNKGGSFDVTMKLGGGLGDIGSIMEIPDVPPPTAAYSASPNAGVFRKTPPVRPEPVAAMNVPPPRPVASTASVDPPVEQQPPPAAAQQQQQAMPPQHPMRMDPPTSGDGASPSGRSSSASYASPTSVASKSLQKAKLGRRGSHRRWASHGMEGGIKKASSVDCLDDAGRGNGRRGGDVVDDADDVMAFGIAAYTDFV